MLKFFTLAIALCRNDLQDRFAGSLLGSIWLLIWPLVQMAVYILVFGKLMGGRLAEGDRIFSYGLYIASGLLCWTCFANSLAKSCRIFVDRRTVLRKVNIPLPVLPVSACLGEVMPFCAGMVLLALASWHTGRLPDISWLFLLLLSFYCQLALACGAGLLLACVAVFSRDIIELTNIALQLAFWFTPIVYLPSILPNWLASVLWLNPMTPLIQIFQQAFVLGGEVAWLQFAWAVLLSQLALVSGLLLCRHWNRELRDVM